MSKISTSRIKSEEVTQILQPTFFIVLSAYEDVYISDSNTSHFLLSQKIRLLYTNAKP